MGKCSADASSHPIGTMPGLMSVTGAIWRLRQSEGAVSDVASLGIAVSIPVAFGAAPNGDVLVASERGREASRRRLRQRPLRGMV
jgi:hypothetical protein